MSPQTPRAVVARVTAPLVAGVVFALLTLVINAPPSALQEATFPLALPFAATILRQDWHLFAPAPFTTDDQVWYQIRYREGDRTVETAPASLSARFTGDAKRQWYSPSRIDRVAIILGVAFSTVHNERVTGSSDNDVQRAKVGALKQLLGPTAQRAVSGVAATDRPGTPVAGVRAWYVSVPVPAPGAPPGPPPAAPILEDTGWLPAAAVEGP